MRRSGAAGGFGGRTAPRMTRNAKARDVLEVILTIVLRCEPTGRDARLGKGERGGFGGSAEVRRPGAETCAHLISEPSQPGGSTARSRRRDRSTRASERGRVGRAGPHLVRFARERANAVTGRDVRSPDVWRRARSSAAPSAVQREEKLRRFGRVWLQNRRRFSVAFKSHINENKAEVFAKIQHCRPILLLAPSVTSTRLPLTRTDPEMLPEPTEPRSVL